MIEEPTNEKTLQQKLKPLFLGTKFIDKKLLQKIYDKKNYEDKRNYLPIRLAQIVKEKNYLTKKLQSSQEYQLALDLYKQTQKFRLLKTGQYLAEKQSNKMLIFSEYLAIYLSQDRKGVITGFKFRYNKSLFIGSFQIKKQQILYSGFGTLHRQDEQKIIVFHGKQWENNEIKFGSKTISMLIPSTNHILEEDEQVMEKYEGTFINMKYQGKGTLRLFKDGNKTTTQIGTFQCGMLIKRDQPNSNV